MIVLNLICISGHRFEGWFGSRNDFDTQLNDGALSCPVCGTGKVDCLPSGPHVARRMTPVQEGVVSAEQVLGFLRELAQDSEDVGSRFAEEARRIHFNEAPARKIRGLATLTEAADLIDEGIPVLPVPPKNEKH